MKKDEWMKGRLKWRGTKTKCVVRNDRNREARPDNESSETAKKGRIWGQIKTADNNTEDRGDCRETERDG